MLRNPLRVQTPRPLKVWPSPDDPMRQPMAQGPSEPAASWEPQAPHSRGLLALPGPASFQTPLSRSGPGPGSRNPSRAFPAPRQASLGTGFSSGISTPLTASAICQSPPPPHIKHSPRTGLGAPILAAHTEAGALRRELARLPGTRGRRQCKRPEPPAYPQPPPPGSLSAPSSAHPAGTQGLHLCPSRLTWDWA